MTILAITCLLVAVGACQSPVKTTSEPSPTEIVARYLSLAAGQPDQAKAMLSEEATIMIFDLAGSLDEYFPQLIRRLSESECIRCSLKGEGKYLGNAGIDAEVVRVEWKCATPTEGIPASTTIRFYVDQHKINGAMIEDPPGYGASFPSAL